MSLKPNSTHICSKCATVYNGYVCPKCNPKTYIALKAAEFLGSMLTKKK